MFLDHAVPSTVQSLKKSRRTRTELFFTLSKISSPTVAFPDLTYKIARETLRYETDTPGRGISAMNKVKPTRAEVLCSDDEQGEPEGGGEGVYSRHTRSTALSQPRGPRSEMRHHPTRPRQK